LAENGNDIAYLMGWEDKPALTREQPQLFVNFSEEENKLLEIIREAGEISIDQLVIKSGLLASKVAAALLNLEFEGAVQSIPGKRYKT